jgi:hypothetical protein
LYSALDELISQTDAKGKKPVLSYEKKNQKHYFMLVIAIEFASVSNIFSDSDILFVFPFYFIISGIVF